MYKQNIISYWLAAVNNNNASNYATIGPFDIKETFYTSKSSTCITARF